MQEETRKEPFSEFEDTPKIRRRKLLPWWMKVFIWIFFLFGAFMPVALVLGAMGSNVDLAIYGLETNIPFSTIGLVVIGLFTLKALTSIGLWFEKDWGVKFGLADAIVGLVVCFGMMIAPWVSDYSGGILRLEILFLLPYLSRLLKIRKKWEING